MAKWGITLDTLLAANPRVVFASMSAFGTEGPLSPRR
jgi:crotonobetainyl-CoA:carnitine CoA-transferase CaiB-like acyl-CoA transferase